MNMDKRYTVKQLADVALGTPCVFANSVSQAEAVAAVLTKGAYRPDSYVWHVRDDRPPPKSFQWWCVVEETPWAVIPAWDVQPGEAYFGPYEAPYLASMLEIADRLTAEGVTRKDGTPKMGPCDARKRLAVVQRDVPKVRRSELQRGDAFVYLSCPDDRSVASDVKIEGLPAGWYYSSDASMNPEARVFRIPHWSQVKTEPTPLPATAPLLVDALAAELEARRIQKVDGVDGKECMWRFENAMRNESLATTGAGIVSTHGDYPLTAAQVDLAREVWDLELRLKTRNARRAAVEKERNRVLCEDSSEL
jgi:hypothetical protein